MLKIYKQISFPKAVIFDTDNTLYPYFPAHNFATRAVEEKAQSVLGVSASHFSRTLLIARKEIKSILGETASSHSRLLYFQRTIEKLNGKSDIFVSLDLEQTYWSNFLTHTKLFNDVLDFITLLKSKNVLVANITDLTAQIQFRKLIYFGVDQLFDFVVSSEECGVDKPSNLPFQTAIEKLMVKPHEIWMIGDNPISDIYGAKSCGIRTLQKIHKGVKAGTDKNLPDIAFGEFSSLISYFSKLK